MRISVISWIRNEADILETFVRHHAQFADDIRIVLHRCRDNSEEILKALQAEGLPVVFRTDERLLHEQDPVQNELAHEAAANGAEWILPLDGDEFLVGDIEATLGKASTTMPIRVPWKGYVPTGQDRADEPNILRRITRRRSNENPQWHKMLVPADLLRQSPPCAISFGNHVVMGSDKNILESVESPLWLAHFPIRSDRQVRAKIFGGWLVNLADRTHEKGSSFQWKAIFDLLKQKSELSTDDLEKIALSYAGADQWFGLPEEFKIKNASWSPKERGVMPVPVEDPVPSPFKVTIPMRSADPISVLLESAEDIAQAARRDGTI